MSTIPVIFVGHGGYPNGVLDAVEMILGAQPHVAAVSLAPDGSTEEVAEQVSSAIGRLGGTGHAALVLADLMGGSPSNAVGLLALRNPELHLVAGLNLPMVLEVLTSTADTAAELASVAEGAGRAGVVDVAARLRAAAAASQSGSSRSGA
ncbi:MAG TPA: PTS mannose transporter subunit IIAB [Pseudonocardiaceae bacterium]|jgi:mannose/fructose/sorbose-specific phosphotransferase system IIA component|nr:PTS mannose transporter subunit IIAB [Pseudonocardiaceae bacterium]